VYERVDARPGPPDAPGAAGSAPPEASHHAGLSLGIVQPSPSTLAGLLAGSSAGTLSPWIRERGTPTDNLLHHFSSSSAAIMGQPFDPQLWELAGRYQFLVPTMLAVSASHLRHHTADPAPHHIVELGLVAASISTLKSALALPLDKERADALLCTAVILNAVTFADVTDRSPAASWVFSRSPDRLCWLDMLLRFKKLEQATFQFRASSVLQPILDAANAPAAQDREAGLDGLPEAWRWLIGDPAGPRFDLFCQPVRILSELSGQTKITCFTALAYFGLVNKFTEGFRDLLFEREPRAMWVFGYWLGMLGRLNIWWCARRVERDRAAVRIFLTDLAVGRRPGKEGRMWRVLMEDLASASEWPPPSPQSDDGSSVSPEDGNPSPARRVSDDVDSGAESGGAPVVSGTTTRQP